MRGTVAAVGVGLLLIVHAPLGETVPPPPVVIRVDADGFEISAEGNTVTGVRRAPVPYQTVTAVAAAVTQPAVLATAVRLVRATPPEVRDYVFCVTEEGILVVGQQVRRLDASGYYAFEDGDIKRAYPALEATVPWTWIVDLPLGREAALILELRAMSPTWPVRGVLVTPNVQR